MGAMADNTTPSPAARGGSASAKRLKDRSGKPGKPSSREAISEEAVPYLLRQVAERLSRSLAESLKPFEQPANVYRILIALERRGPVTIGELAEATLIEPSTLSRTIDRMEDEGFVKHGPDTEDGRSVMVEITPSGRAFFQDILPVASAQYEWSIRGVSAKNLRILQATLKQMLGNLKVSPFK